MSTSGPVGSMCDILIPEGFLKAYGIEGTWAEPFLPSLLNATYRLETLGGVHLICIFGPDDWAGASDAARLLKCLHESGVPCPLPLAKAGGEWGGMFDGHPALVLNYPPGQAAAYYTPTQGAALGSLLARMHLAANDCTAAHTAARMVRVWREKAVATSGLPHEDAALLQDEVRYQNLYRFDDLPQGIVHGGATHEMILFKDDRISGILGLEDARRDVWLLDLAVSATDCCGRHDGSLDMECVLALLVAYHQMRPLNPIERGAWPVMLRAVALQRWVNALQKGVNMASHALIERARLLDRIAQEHLLQRVWP